MSATTFTGETLANDTLYDRVGGAPAIEAAVHDFYARVLADDDLTPFFEGVDLDRLRAHQRAFLAAALGGPEQYHGRSLAAAHRGLRITDGVFARVVGHLVETLRALGVDANTITAIADALAPLQPEIVTADG